ncbi:MAG TPA: carboxylating nicotinate-nucleotide diphosphorylase [Acidimicrobiales bacterium]|nr:carboxylating nicotinate-nucleotide diphosphorylase [Acidimicrobiales bacterium]
MIEPHPPLVSVREAVTRALVEDLAPLGDMTASLLPVDRQGAALLVSRDEGVMAGRLCATESFLQVDPMVVVEWHLDDGADLAPGDVLGRVEGPLSSILTGERTALNFLRHLSGVATLTRRFVRATQGRATILDTRKTTPGLRTLEKAAVRAGGGTNHRGSLSDGVLIKDNHLGGMSIAEAVRRAKLRWPGRLVEVECDRIEQVTEAIEAGATMVMLDNMTPAQVREAVKVAEDAAVANGAGRVPVEVSGRMSLDSVGDYASIAGVDFISVGALTHSAPVLDVGLDLEGG